MTGEAARLTARLRIHPPGSRRVAGDVEVVKAFNGGGEEHGVRKAVQLLDGEEKVGRGRFAAEAGRWRVGGRWEDFGIFPGITLRGRTERPQSAGSAALTRQQPMRGERKAQDQRNGIRLGGSFAPHWRPSRREGATRHLISGPSPGGLNGRALRGGLAGMKIRRPWLRRISAVPSPSAAGR